MQVIHKNEVEEGTSGGTNPMDIIICPRWIIWKKNMMEELETEEIEFESVGEFLAEIKKEFGGGDEESVKVVELKKIEQGGRTMKEFVQDFKRVARRSGYKGCPLIEEFKWGMNGSIRRKLMEAENQPGSIEQWFKRAITLDRN